MPRKAKSALDTLYSRAKIARKAASKGRARWRQSKGGACDAESTKKRPCTIVYKSGKGKRTISIGVKSSRSAMFALPKRLRSLSDLRGMPGVELPRNLAARVRFKGKSSGLGRMVARKASKGRRASKGRSASKGRARAYSPAAAAARGRQELFAAARRISTGRSR